MTSKSTVDDFLAQRTLAAVGVSHDPKAFANSTYRELKAKGFRPLQANPHMETFDGERCYPSLKALSEPAGGAPSAWR
jgi:predicted CoA-binding protein